MTVMREIQHVHIFIDILQPFAVRRTFVGADEPDAVGLRRIRATVTTIAARDSQLTHLVPVRLRKVLESV